MRKISILFMTFCCAAVLSPDREAKAATDAQIVMLIKVASVRCRLGITEEARTWLDYMVSAGIPSDERSTAEDIAFQAFDYNAAEKGFISYCVEMRGYFMDLGLLP